MVLIYTEGIKEMFLKSPPLVRQLSLTRNHFILMTPLVHNKPALKLEVLGYYLVYAHPRTRGVEIVKQARSTFQ